MGCAPLDYLTRYVAPSQKNHCMGTDKTGTDRQQKLCALSTGMHHGGCTIKKNNKRRIHLTKVIHNILLTNMYTEMIQKCPSCSEECTEDQDHLLRCNSERRTSWQAQMIASMANWSATLQTDPGYCKATWFNSYETTTPNKYPAKYRHLIRQQNRIGWRQLFSGCSVANGQDTRTATCLFDRGDIKIHTDWRMILDITKNPTGALAIVDDGNHTRNMGKVV
jgi:hypothetical protein